MTLTYLGDLSTDRDKVRFTIQDTTASAGPKPSNANFTDDEIDGLLALEGSWQKAVAAAFEVLASAWSKYASFSVGPRGEQLAQVAEAYRKQAETWRGKYGYGATTTGVGSVAITRVDGYSDDVAADEVDQANSEYEPIKWYVEYEHD